ncbi:hypothetical protein OROGR_029754 [Orobanche gracilis]
MVWFQCEDCGGNLKKPKLANHFRLLRFQVIVYRLWASIWPARCGKAHSVHY